MGSRRTVWVAGAFWIASLGTAEAQWGNPKLIAGQVGFNVAASFFGKLLFRHEPPGRALREALSEGCASGLMAHAGYSIAGKHPEWALVGKVLAQKSTLTTRRSIEGLPIFDKSLYSHWELTHSFVRFRWDGSAHVELDALNTATSAYFLFSGDRYHLDARRSLLSGSLVFRNLDPPRGLRGYYLPGSIWIGETRDDYDRIWGHELVHSLQAERGASLSEWQWRGLRINWLVFASGVPALLTGWPEHDHRLHELEADAYAGTD